MADPIITNNDLGSVVLDGAKFDNEVLNFPGADTYIEGTLLARRRVDTAVVATADGGNTGDGTCTAVSVIAGGVVPIAGGYNLECVELTANGGIFKLEDPNGVLIDGNLVMFAGAGEVTVFTAGGLTFTLTDGATDFIVGDKFALAVVANGDMVVYARDGEAGTGIPVAVLTYEIVATGAGDVAIRALIAGQVRREKLLVDAGAAAVNDNEVDALRDYSIIATPVTELNTQDNQ